MPKGYNRKPRTHYSVGNAALGLIIVAVLLLAYGAKLLYEYVVK